jgi:hypothetical protein
MKNGMRTTNRRTGGRGSEDLRRHWRKAEWPRHAGYLTELIAPRYDLSWVADSDVVLRLARAQGLLRSLVQVTFPGLISVGWASQDAPFQGVTIHGRTKQILINPAPVLAHRGHVGIAALLDALQGVAAHEGGHAAFTPRSWGARLQEAREAHRHRAGYGLPDTLLIPIANWIEDSYCEARVAEEFPAFAIYFQNARVFFLPDAKGHEILTQAGDLRQRCRDGAALLPEKLDLLAACVNLLSVLVNRPGIVDAACEGGFAPLLAAAREIHAAGRRKRVGNRMSAAVAITDRLFRFLGGMIAPERPDLSAPGNSSDFSYGAVPGGDRQREPAGTEQAPFEELAGMIDAALPKRRIAILRDGGDPVSTEAVGTTLTREHTAALDALEKATADRLLVTVPAAWPNVAEHRDKTVRVLESAPENLYNASAYDLQRLADELFAGHRHLAEELKRRLRFRDVPNELLDYGQRNGELDESALPFVRMGERAVFYRREQVDAPRLDLTLLMDESGSMGTADRWKRAAAAAICLEYALRDLASVRFRVFGFTSDCFAAGQTEIYKHYDSAVPRLRRPAALGWCYPKYNNADGVALRAVREILLRDYASETLPCLLMIGDGEPHAHGYSGKAALEHVGHEVQQTLRAGIRFAHLQVGDTAEAALDLSYLGRWCRVTCPEEIPVQVVHLVMRWLDPGR